MSSPVVSLYPRHDPTKYGFSPPGQSNPFSPVAPGPSLMYPVHAQGYTAANGYIGSATSYTPPQLPAPEADEVTSGKKSDDDPHDAHV